MNLTNEEVMAIINLAVTLAPPTVQLINHLIEAMQEVPSEDRMKMILDLQTKLHPMQPVSE